MSLTPQQAEPYWEQNDILGGLMRKWERQGWLSEIDQKRVLCCLQNMRMLCNSTFLFDKKLLPEPGDSDDCPFLRSIDNYGDTTFNRLQMPLFLKEWAAISVKATTEDQQAIVLAVESLARRCRDEVHIYLKFIGD